ncbi:MAG TPA: hemerythrin domain-containing protein [Methylomirabilota bacterium]|jgi:hemerythrin superfamily protein|nr:hemerythrin domain-containing protein [Methylomirabilota bacterium]
MKATQLLRTDHAKIRKLFSEFDRTTERAPRTRQRLVERIASELEVHSQIEEEIFYPAVDEVDALMGLVQESRREHQRVKVLVSEVRKMEPDSPRLQEAIAALRDAVVHHAIDEEEKRMLPEAEKALGADALERLGRELSARKAALLRQPGKRLRAAA